MASFPDERLERFRRRFLDAHERFPDLRFVAATPPEPERRFFPEVPTRDGLSHHGLSEGHWKEVLSRRILSQGPAILLGPPVWLRLAGDLWEGRFFADAPLCDDVLAQDKELQEAIAEFERLSREAVGHFDMPSSPTPKADDLPREATPTTQWLEAVVGMDFVPTEDANRCGYVVREVPGSLFIASARTVENLANTGFGNAGGNLIERLLAGRDDVELTARELAFLTAHLHNNRPRMSWWQQKNKGIKCPQLERYQKLKTILDFNRTFQRSPDISSPSKEDAPYTIGDLLTDLSGIEASRADVERLHTESKAAGPAVRGSLAAHKAILRDMRRAEGQRQRAAMLSKRGVDRLQTVCVAHGGKLSVSVLQGLCASAALALGMTLNQFRELDTEKAADQLETFLTTKQSEGNGRAKPTPATEPDEGPPRVRTVADILNLASKGSGSGNVVFDSLSDADVWGRLLGHTYEIYGKTLSDIEVVRRLVGKVANKHGMMIDEVRRLSLSEFWELLEKTLNPPNDNGSGGVPTGGPTTQAEQGEKSGGAGSTIEKAGKGRHKRGRKKLTKDEARHRNDILLKWERARNEGTAMKAFCKEHAPPLSVKELERFVAWKAARRRRKGDE